MRIEISSEVFRAAIQNRSTLPHKNFPTGCVLGSRQHAQFIFRVKKIFFAKLKIKFIFFLSVLQPISSLKPAGEDDHKACVNKL